MIDVLSQATHNFVQHQLRLTSTEETACSSNDYFHANINLIANGQGKTISFYYTNDFIQLVSQALLGETSDEQEAIEDLVGETTNLIAGSAKTISSNAFDIGLPHYLGEVTQIPDNGTYRAFSIDNKTMLCITLN